MGFGNWMTRMHEWQNRPRHWAKSEKTKKSLISIWIHMKTGRKTVLKLLMSKCFDRHKPDLLSWPRGLHLCFSWDYPCLQILQIHTGVQILANGSSDVWNRLEVHNEVGVQSLLPSCWDLLLYWHLKPKVWQPRILPKVSTLSRLHLLNMSSSVQDNLTRKASVWLINFNWLRQGSRR